MCAWTDHTWTHGHMDTRTHTYIHTHTTTYSIAVTSGVSQLSVPVYLTGLSNRIACQILRPSRVWYQHI